MWSCVKYPLTLPTLVLLIMTGVPSLAQDRTASMQPSVARLETELTARHGEQQRPRIQRGLRQVAEFWRADDGDAVAFEAFTRENFAGDQKSLDAMFTRFEALLEQLDGHMTEIGRVFRNQTDLDLGPIMPFDEAFAGYDPSAHVNEDFFTNKLAFMVLLNFPLTTLEQRLGEGTQWSRRQWAEARLAQRFSRRIPADVNLAIAKAASEADRYISEYNIWMHHLVNEKGERLFPAGLRLLSHWNLRDQIKADYSDPKTGPAKQKMIQKVMERIVTQTIPASVVDNPRVDWNPFTNEVKQSTVKDHDLPASTATVHNDAEPDTRYAVLLETFLASRKADPYSPTAPTLIARRFN